MKEHIIFAWNSFRHSPPERVEFTKLCFSFFFVSIFLCDTRTVCWCAIFTLRRRDVAGMRESKLKWLWWNINLHKKIIKEKETRKLNSLRKEWFIVLNTEHVLCCGAKSIQNFPSFLTFKIISFDSFLRTRKLSCNDHD